MSEVASFFTSISALDLNEVDIAVAVLWLLDQAEPGIEVSATELARRMHEASIRGAVNASRLAGKLAGHSDVVRGKARNAFRIRLGSKSSLTQRYGEYLGPTAPVVDDHILPHMLITNTRPNLEAIALQINGSYQFQFYDSCAVMCRRIAEMLLIEAFDAQGHGAAIKGPDGNYFQFNELIGRAQSGQYFKLARNSPKTLERVKTVGDTGAHHRSYITMKRDVDDLKFDLRHLITDLIQLAKIQRRKSP